VSIFDDYGQLITDSIRLAETINDALFTADGNTVFTTTVDSNSVFWHLNSAILRGYSFKEKVATSDFSPDNRRFVSVEWRDSVRFTLREADGSMSRVIGKYPEWTQVNEVKFMPDSRRILTFTEGNELYFVAEGEKPQLLLNGAKPKRIWVADDRQHMAIELKSALELRTTEGKMIQTMRQTRGVNGDVSKIAFSPDGMRLAVVYNTGKVVFWWTPRAVLARVQARHRA
jgi:WD40 repeat protein